LSVLQKSERAFSPTAGELSQMTKDALISRDGFYRYWLSRTWDHDKKIVIFIGLNPSTADAEKDDPTIRRCISFAQDWGYGGLVMLNLFAFRATHPADMRRAEDPVGPDNDGYIKFMTAGKTTVCCWGTHGHYKNRDNEVLEMIQDPKMMALSKYGFPRHPLYLRKSLKPMGFKNK